MNNKVIEFNQSQQNVDTPDMRPGDIVRVHRKIKEGEKERVQIFEGMIIAVKGGQSSSPMITVRKVSNGTGVEIIVPIYSPNIAQIEFVKRAKVRRSKLYYVRDKAAKALRFKFSDMSGKLFSKDAEQVFEEKAEEAVMDDGKNDKAAAQNSVDTHTTEKTEAATNATADTQEGTSQKEEKKSE